MSRNLNRGTGLLIINVVNSNPNGDPDGESEPRTFDDGRGLISPVSFKRKVRDLVEAKGFAYDLARSVVQTTNGLEILESRGRDRKALVAMDRDSFKARFWDARVFGSTFLEEKTDDNSKDKKQQKRDEHIATGVVQFGVGASLAPLNVIRLTLTNKAGVEEGKDRGMAPLAFRVAQHGLYVMPFFVNASAATKSGCDIADIELLKCLIPHAYTQTTSVIRPQVDLVHAWYAEHKNPLGSCPDPLLISALTPKKLGDPERASSSLADYEIPDALPDHLRARLASFEDLTTKDWAAKQAAE